MKYIFIDTNLFIDAMTSNDVENILNSISKQLIKGNIKLILPEVIKIEILTEYNFQKDGVVKAIGLNLETKKILGIEEPLTDAGKKNNKKQKVEIETEKINNVIEPYRKEMIKKIEEHYKSILKMINQIFKHRNTRIITLTDQILLAGIKRSVLKRAPYTRKDPHVKPEKHENTHTKDIDCIAFETLLAFCKKNTDKQKRDILIMCVSDPDYFSLDGKLHADLMKDIKLENKSYQSIPEMLNKEFQIKIESRKLKKVKGLENKTGSLAGSGGVLIEESKAITQ